MEEETFTHEELKRRVLEGMNDLPSTPGLAEAAREVIAPHIEGMLGKEIVYSCRWPFIILIQELELDDERFSAVSVLKRSIPLDERNLSLRSPFRFGASWGGMTMCGAAISMKMLVDYFITDPLIVRRVKEAADGPEPAIQVHKILMAAMDPKL